MARTDAAAAAPATVTLSGTIVDLSGEPVSGVEVHAGYTYHELPIATAVTAADGTFTMPVTTEWKFPFQVGDADALGLVGGFLAVDGTLIDGYETMRRFEAVPGYVELGDIQLRQGHQVGGTITVAGLPAGATTEARLLLSPGGADYTYREEFIRIGNGANPWSIVLPDGEFGVRLSASSHAILTYPTRGAESVVVSGASVPDVDFTVDLSGRSVAGSVVDADGSPVGGAHVSLAPEDSNGQYHWTTTADDGAYVLGSVKSGSYRLAFSFENGPASYWDGATSYEDADLIVVVESTPSLAGYDAVVYRGASVAGTSTDPDGTPRSGDVVRAYRDGVEQRMAYVGYDGTFTFTGLPAGDYTFSMEQGGWGGLLQYFDGVITAEQATVVPLTEGEAVDGIDFVSREGASIAGTVELSDGTPIAGAVVRAFAANDQDSPIAEATTDAAGTYEIDELNANNYALAVSGGTPLVASRWFGGSGVRSDASAISLGADESATAAFEVDLGATIRGTVILPEGETFVSLSAWEAMGSADSTWIGVSSEEPGGQVEWALPGLAAGTWRVTASAGNAWMDTADIPLEGGDEVVDISIDLSAPSQLAGDVTLKGEPDATLSGRVTLLDSAQEWVAEDWIDSGRYSFSNVAPGTYVMVVQAKDWDGGATRIARAEVEIPSDGSPPVAFDVEVEPGIPVGGRVFDAATGSPISGANLNWNRETGFGSLGSDGWGSGTTTGQFELTVDDPGIVELSATAEYEDYLQTAVDVDVPESGVSGLEIGLTKGASVSGRIVSENNGVPLPNVSVHLTDVGGSWRYSGYTDSDGRYTVHGVLTGTYRVELTNYSGLYVSEWYDDQPSFETAAEISVGSEPLTGVDAALSLGSVITGTVTDPDGAPIPWAEVGLAVPPTPVETFMGFVAEVFGAEPAVGRLLDVEVYTDENGGFRFPAVPAGEYAIYIREGAHRTTWYNGKATLDTADLVSTSTGGVATVQMTAEPLADGESSLAPEQTLTTEFAVTLHPDDTSAADGEWVELRAAASGTPVPTIEWERRAPGGEWESLGVGDVSYWFAAEFALDGYQYRVVFTHDGATLISEAATLTVRAAPSVPDAPAAPSADQITSTGATISWVPPADNGAAISGYTVRLFESGSDVPIRTLELGITTQQVFGGLDPESEYEVEVSARNAVGSGEHSERTSFSTPEAPPGVPDAPAAPTVDDVMIDGATIAWVPPADNRSAILGYAVSVYLAGSETIVERLDVGPLTEVSVDGLDPGIDYEVAVTARNAIGEGDPSIRTAFTTPPSVPSAPGAPVVDEVSSIDAKVTWGASADNGSVLLGYTVRLFAAGAGEPVRTLELGVDMSVTVGGLDPETDYEVDVTARNGVGSSAASPRTSFTSAAAPPQPTVPAAPTDVSAAPGDRQVAVSWTPPADDGGSAITGYTVTASPGGATVETTSASTSATVLGLSNGTSYTFVVSARNVVGDSMPSTPSASVTPSAAVDPVVERLWGADRYSTSAEISSKNFSSGVPVAYVASGAGFADALSGAPVAGMKDAPVLLVGSGISSEVAAELTRLKPGKIVILGGAGVVSSSVAAQLDAYTSGA
ncbi:carboxypeptidase regulatory-like domain-containing protein, partial [Agromyces sp. M3QZ16-3]|uniref:carboxypeptidase regulatory-like domain-containing protein n=1 Tax=Agromyces sp. M3QZ16-3 TaxID=3447585 RepID=UPI003F694BE7